MKTIMLAILLFTGEIFAQDTWSFCPGDTTLYRLVTKKCEYFEPLVTGSCYNQKKGVYTIQIPEYPNYIVAKVLPPCKDSKVPYSITVFFHGYNYEQYDSRSFTGVDYFIKHLSARYKGKTCGYSLIVPMSRDETKNELGTRADVTSFNCDYKNQNVIPKVFPTIVKNAEKFISSVIGDNASIDIGRSDIILAGHSGGGVPILNIMDFIVRTPSAKTMGDRIKEINMYDAFYFNKEDQYKTIIDYAKLFNNTAINIFLDSGDDGSNIQYVNLFKKSPLFSSADKRVKSYIRFFNSPHSYKTKSSQAAMANHYEVLDVCWLNSKKCLEDKN
jgi:hypothetical protein